MPAPADGAVVGTRRWFDEHGGVVPTCEAGVAMPPQLSKRDAIERYHQHTKHCKVCSQVGSQGPMPSVQTRSDDPLKAL